MTTAADILAYLDTLAPQSLKMSWDNAGQLCGRREQAVKTILVALDPFPSVIQEAIDLDADLERRQMGDVSLSRLQTEALQYERRPPHIA